MMASKKPSPESRQEALQEKTYIGDYGERLQGLPRVTAIISMLAISLAMGVVIGLFVQIMLLVMNLLINLLWSAVPAGEGLWWFPLVLCPLGGIVIGVWNARFHAAPRPLGEVLACVKRKGVYRVKNVPAAIVSFFLPLAFGGSVGPEAGLTGFISDFATRLSAVLRRAGLRARSLSDVTVAATICAVFGAPFAGFVAAAEHMPGERPDQSLFTYRKIVKFLLYAIAAGGAFLGMWLVGLILPVGSGLPRFATMEMPLEQLPWIIVCIAAGYVLALAFSASERGAKLVARKLDGHEVVMALVAGIVLGVLGMFLPDVLFSGEEQCREIALTWQDCSALVLIATAFAKVAATPLCITMGWRGGEIFPCIFSGVALGFGIACLTGADGVFCATCTCAAFLGAKMQKPVLAIALLLLCFPIASLPWLIIAGVAGAFIPKPRIVRETPAPRDLGRQAKKY